MTSTWRTLMKAAVVAATLAAGARAAAAEGAMRTIVLHVDDYAHIAASERATAEAEATRIYADGWRPRDLGGWARLIHTTPALTG